ncbi:MAG TPA: amino acid permease [Bacteroidales bacterium]|nr:amino acid permease [Bacteroidales bacterium]HBZ21191.1 amino acid permease [Bacteroidales bacterium]
MAKLAKELTLYGLIMVAIGSCIGSGIFVTPSQIAGLIPSSGLILVVWALGGLIALTGALTFGELGSLFPRAGGIYVYLKEAYGGWLGFLYGWAYLVIITSGSIAVLALAFSHYLSFFIPMDNTWKTISSIITIMLLTTLNVFRAKFGEIFSNIFTGLKIIGILVIICSGFLLGTSDLSFKDLGFIGSGSSTAGISGFGVALTGVLFSYGGWQHASFLAGETKNPSRNVPIAMITGAAVVTLIYLLVNTSYMLLLPVNSIMTSEKVAAEAVSTVIPFGGMFVAGLIAVSTFGTIGIYTLSTPRIYYAMAEDGLFFKSIANVHPVFKTPVNAIVAQSVWSVILLLFWGTLENLITYTVSVEWIFFTLAAAGIFIFRKRIKNTERPYKTFGYPVTPLIFIVINTWFVFNIMINKPLHMIIGFGFLLLGVPLYIYFKKRNAEQ